MKKSTMNMRAKKTAFCYLQMLHLTIKDICKLIGIAEQTGGAWNKENTLKDFQYMIDNYRKRISNALEDSTVKNSEILRMCKSYENLQKEYDDKIEMAKELHGWYLNPLNK